VNKGKKHFFSQMGHKGEKEAEFQLDFKKRAGIAY
jgi:hypothetical protein